MELFYHELDNKFSSILSGFCLTTLREENKKIAKKYEFFDINELKELTNDFLIYIRNFLKLKNYEFLSIDQQSVLVKNQGEVNRFFIDFDHGDQAEEIKIKILDKGVKCGISTNEEKYIFIISINKKCIYLFNLEKLKSFFKENQNSRKLITETDSLFKTQYILFDAKNIGQKGKFFNIN